MVLFHLLIVSYLGAQPVRNTSIDPHFILYIHKDTYARLVRGVNTYAYAQSIITIYFNTSVVLFHLLIVSYLGAWPVRNTCLEPHFILYIHKDTYAWLVRGVNTYAYA